MPAVFSPGISLLNGLCLLVPVLWHDNDSPALQMPPRSALEKEGKQVNYHNNGDTESGADAGHCIRNDRDDFLIANGRL